MLALLPYPVGRVAGQRFRMEQWAPLLAAEGVSVTHSPFLDGPALDVLYRPGHAAQKASAVFSGYVRRLRELAAFGRFDVLFVYREAAMLGTAWIESLAARKRPIVFDFDDAIYVPTTSDANRAFGFLKRTSKVPAICRLARAVTVGNEALAAFAREHSTHVEIVPTTIDTETYQVVARRPNARPVIGWTGSTTTAGYLTRMAPALRRLRAQCDFELLVIGADVKVEGVNVRCLPWRAATETDDIRQMDVGLMPLTDDVWARGKCALKALQYMALGIPPVVSPVGVNGEVVKDGVSGFHAVTDDDWVNKVTALIRDADLRLRMGVAARQTVEARYAARVHAPRLASLLRQVHRDACGAR